MGKRNYTICCQCCGKKAEYTHCSSMGTPPDNALCKVLSGWLTVSQWKGMGAVERYDFCSFGCLQRWVNAQVPRVPETFLKAFEEG